MLYGRILILWRFVYTKGFSVPLLLPFMPYIFIPLQTMAWKLRVKEHTVGHYTKEEATEMAINDLRSLSAYLGKVFIKNH